MIIAPLTMIRRHLVRRLAPIAGLGPVIGPGPFFHLLPPQTDGVWPKPTRLELLLRSGNTSSGDSNLAEGFSILDQGVDS
jgi:hypothetical protein